MGFLSIAHSDVGIKKNTNQDSVLIKQASTDYGEVLLSVICDGMGGLAKGEVASAALIRAFSEWFEKEFPFILYEEKETKGIDYNSLQRSWNQLIDKVNHRIADYGAGFHAPCGTTLVALLMTDNQYYIVNVGDSRTYQLNGSLHQITRDQTYVQREMDEGRMTAEEARNHPQRNVLLQCVGASQVVIPDFYQGEYKKGEVFILCSDGFRHLITDEEFIKILSPQLLTDEKAMRDAAVYCTELNKQRKESDNISVVIIKTE